MKLPVELQAGETVALVCRRHWMYFYPRLAFYILVAIVPPILLMVLISQVSGLDGIAGRIVAALALVWLLAWSVRTYFLWYRFQNDLWIITNQRLVDSIKRHWFHHAMSSADLINIADISTSKNGVLARAFDFGDVRCETAGDRTSFVLAGIPQPGKVLTMIDALRDASRREVARVPQA